jgi:hypothetical protein
VVGPGGVPAFSNFKGLVCPTGLKSLIEGKGELFRLSNQRRSTSSDSPARCHRFKPNTVISERNEENDEADAKIRARADLRYLARISPPIPEAIQEAHRLIEADRENARQ